VASSCSIITMAAIAIIILFLFVLVAIIITAILIPGFMENIGFVQIVGGTPRLDLYSTNLIIINNAYALNVGRLANMEQQQNAKLASIDGELNNFNAYQQTRIATFNTQYQGYLTAYTALYSNSTPDLSFVCPAFLNPPNSIVAAQVGLNLNISAVACKIVPIDARIYTGYQPDIFESGLSTIYDTYVSALRNVVLNTLIILGALIVIEIGLTIIFKITFKFLKRMGSIRINETYWFVPIRNDPIGEYIDEETETMLYETKVINFEVAIRFGFVFEGIGIAKTKFPDPLAEIVDEEKDLENNDPEKEKQNKKKEKEEKKKEKEEKKEEKKKDNNKDIELTETPVKPSDLIKKINEQNTPQNPPPKRKLETKPSLIVSLTLKVSHLVGNDLAELKEVVKRTTELESWITKTYSESLEQMNFTFINTLCQLLLSSKKDTAFKNLTDLETALKERLLALVMIVKKIARVKHEKELEKQKEKEKAKVKSDTK